MSGRTFLLALVCGGMSACASIQPAQRVAVDYNRAFAEARDEILLLNILRAAGREPIQFSTMGTASGSIRGTSELSLPLTNLIGGGANPFTVSPGITLTEGSPTLSIIPLSDKDFTEGILRPIGPETLNLFLNQGWDAEFLLTVAIGGIRCPDGTTVLNRANFGAGNHPQRSGDGQPSDGGLQRERALRAMLTAGGSRFAIRQARLNGISTVLRMPSKDSLPFLQNGVGDGHRVTSVEGVGDNALVTIQESTTYWAASGLNSSGPCGSAPTVVEGGRTFAPLTDQNGSPALLLQDLTGESPLRVHQRTNATLLLRSPESIIYFLGEAQRAVMEHEFARCERSGPQNGGLPPYPTYSAPNTESPAKILLRIRSVCGGDAMPARSAVRTHFNGRTYYIPVLEDVAPHDRTLKTLSFLSELIALQTSRSLIESSSPTIAVTR